MTLSRRASAGTATLHRITFDQLDGWADDDHGAALAAFRRGAWVLADHPPKARALGLDAERLATVLRHADALPDPVPSRQARGFFESFFTPHAVVPGHGSVHFTGYYEPQIAASLTPTARFRVPLYRRPGDLVEIEPGSVAALDPEMRFARRFADGGGDKSDHGWEEYFDRGAIMAGALEGRGLELAYLADPVDAYFIHVQGAARLTLPDGRIMPVAYAAKSGHPYTSIGRVLVEHGALRPDNVTMASIRAWLAEHSWQRDDVLAANRSFIFFRPATVSESNLGRGPVAAARVALSAGRSLAVDRLLHSFHTPVWIETTDAKGAPIHRLMMAQDTGSAIVGAARGDIFFGTGDQAGESAGAMNAQGRFIVFVPREATP